MQDSLPPENGIVGAVPEINDTAKAKKPLNFIPSQLNLEIPTHIKEESRSDFS